MVQIYQVKEIWIFLKKISFTEILEKGDGATLFFIAENQENSIFNFYLGSVIVTE